MKALVFCGDRWHPAATVRAGLAPLHGDGYEFDYVEDAADWSAARMAEYPLVVLAKANNVSETNEEPWASEAAQAAERTGKYLCVVQAGDALLFRPLILHASRKATSEKPRRVIHLEFAAASLPMPLGWVGAAA